MFTSPRWHFWFCCVHIAALTVAGISCSLKDDFIRVCLLECKLPEVDKNILLTVAFRVLITVPEHVRESKVSKQGETKGV